MQNKKNIIPLKQRLPCLNPDYPQKYQQLLLQVLQRIQKQQFTSQTNQLIQQLIPFGQNNYSCWIAKKKIYQAGNTTIQHQDKYSQQLLQKQLKNFQLWDYRNFIYNKTKNHDKQYKLMDKILQISPRNYHLWANRTMLVNSVQNYGEELIRTEVFIIKDCYNNSAWNYRYYCFQHLPIKQYEIEIAFVIDKIKKHLDNEASWNYLRGFFPCYRLSTIKFTPLQQKQLLKYADYPMIKQLCEEVISNKELEQIMKIHALMTMIIINSHAEDTVKILQICGYLAGIEPFRANYYNWLKNAL